MNESAFVSSNNQSVLANMTNPASALKKKLNAIACHFLHEGCDWSKWLVAHINTHLNVANLLTKPPFSWGEEGVLCPICHLYGAGQGVRRCGVSLFFADKRCRVASGLWPEPCPMAAWGGGCRIAVGLKSELRWEQMCGRDGPRIEGSSVGLVSPQWDLFAQSTFGCPMEHLAWIEGSISVPC